MRIYLVIFLVLFGCSFDTLIDNNITNKDVTRYYDYPYDNGSGKNPPIDFDDPSWNGPASDPPLEDPSNKEVDFDSLPDWLKDIFKPFPGGGTPPVPPMRDKKD